MSSTSIPSADITNKEMQSALDKVLALVKQANHLEGGLTNLAMMKHKWDIAAEISKIMVSTCKLSMFGWH